VELTKAQNKSKAVIAAAMKASFATKHQKREVKDGLDGDMKGFKKEIARMVKGRRMSGNYKTNFSDVKRNNDRKSFTDKIFSLVDTHKPHNLGLSIGAIMLRIA
jgi:hypothetical protein